jgi:type II secretory pathway pseudopilin PulG
MLVVMSILGTVLAGVTTVFVQGSKAELDVNRRFQSQVQATAAFDRLRRDVHCASSATVSGSTLTLTGCSSDVTWRTCAYGSWYALYRNATSCPANNNATSCGTLPTSASGKLYGSCLTAASFTYTASVADTSLAKVHADVTVNVKPTTTTDAFELVDDIVLRNSLR